MAVIRVFVCLGRCCQVHFLPACGAGSSDGAAVLGEALSAVRLGVIGELQGYPQPRWLPGHSLPLQESVPWSYVLRPPYPCHHLALNDSGHIVVVPRGHRCAVTCPGLLGMRAQQQANGSCLHPSTASPQLLHLSAVPWDTVHPVLVPKAAGGNWVHFLPT